MVNQSIVPNGVHFTQGETIANHTSESSSPAPVYVISESNYLTKASQVDSSFDKLLKARWDSAARQGALKYDFSPKAQRGRLISPGQYLFVATLIEGRAPGKRRQPDEMLALRMQFDPLKFNFTKIDPSEVLFTLKWDDAVHTVIVNKSPIEYCSALLVPSLEQCLPQVLTEESLQLAIQVFALSDQPSLRLGFNSLGAMASVNHQHWHLYYFEHKLAIEDLAVRKHLLQDWPIPAIVFEITDITEAEISIVVKQAMRIIFFCLESGQIAHNLFLSRTSTGAIRLFIWLVEPRFGAKNDLNINPAFCEFSGYFICKTTEMYNEIDEPKCVKLLLGVTSRHEEVLHLLPSD